MIELSANTAIMLYLSLTLAVILGVWCNNHYHTRKRKIVTSEQELHVCEYCHNAYLDEDFKDVTQCPQCKLYNKHNKHKK